VREGDWKLYLQAPLPSQVELFDLANDPGETTNLAAENPEIAGALEARVQELASEMARSKFFEQTFNAYLGREEGPPVFPNETGFYAVHD
jgi:arylsulfatase A-like enzyme